MTSEAWRESWVEALEVLELEVDSAEALLRAADTPEAVSRPPVAWQPPELGPLPADLRERAIVLFERQLAAAEALTRAMLGARRHAELLDRLDGGEPARTAAYVDRPL